VAALAALRAELSADERSTVRTLHLLLWPGRGRFPMIHFDQPLHSR
jgi:hypothetical protein